MGITDDEEVMKKRAEEVASSWKPLHLSAMNDDFSSFLDKAVKFGPPSFRERDKEGRTPLHLAAAFNKTGDGDLIVDWILKNMMVPVDDQDIYGHTALYLALLQRREKMVQILLDHDATTPGIREVIQILMD